jgi:hypothetical protein
MLPFGSLALNLRFKSALKACVANGLVAVLIQNAVGSGTGGGTGGTGAEEVTDVSCAPRMNEPDMIMIVFAFDVFIV